MPRTTLTARGVEAAKPSAKRQEIADAALPGLYLVIQPSGAKAWAVRYRHANKPAKATIGRYPALGLADARTKAREVLAAIDRGEPPTPPRKAVSAPATAPETLDDVTALYIRRHAAGLRSRAEVERIICGTIVPELGTGRDGRPRPMAEVTRRDVLNMLERIAFDRGAPYMANRTHAVCRHLWGWAAERELIPADPVAALRPPAREQSRDRVLSDDEIRLAWRAADRLGWPFGPAVRLLILTGQRRSEVGGIALREVDGDHWTIPAGKTKNGRAHVVPLSRPALDLIADCPRFVSSPLLFSASDRPPSGWSRAKRRLDAAMKEVAAEEGAGPLEIEPWRFHDIRRTVATGMAKLNVPPHVTEAVLNHRTGTVSGVAAVYNRHEYLPERRHALDAWAAHVLDAPTTNVIPLRLGGA